MMVDVNIFSYVVTIDATNLNEIFFETDDFFVLYVINYKKDCSECSIIHSSTFPTLIEIQFMK